MEIEDDSEVIKITVSCKTPFVWKAKDVYHLRKEHRIIGSLTGCLPRVPTQNSLLGLPLQLSNEEARLLLEKGFAKLEVIDTSSVKKNMIFSKELCANYRKLRENIYSQQNELYKKERQKKIELMADEIVEGKKKRHLEKMLGLKGKKKKRKKNSVADLKMEIEIDPEATIEEELNKVIDVPRKSCTVQLFTECPWRTSESRHTLDFKFPDSEHDNIRYQVYKDLWHRGYFITGGSKFGTDFLAYTGDPLRYHAFFMIICTEYSEDLAGLNLVSLGRLSTQVKKTLVLATVKPDATVDYISLNWAPLNLM